jgi:hypothetical protein
MHRLRMVVPLFSKSVCHLCAGSSEIFVFPIRSFSFNSEVSEWRRHRHEYRADL